MNTAITIIAYIIIGITLVNLEVSFNTHWQYWVIFGAVLVVQLTSFKRGMKDSW